MVADFLKQFPNIHIELELTDRFVNLANEGFDLAIRHAHVVPETHVAWVLCDTRSVLVASADYLAQRGMPEHPNDLTAHDCLLYLGNQAGSWTFAKNSKKKSTERVGVNIRGSLKANNSEVLRDAILAGLGIGLLPDFSLPITAKAQTRLVRVLPDWQVQGFFGDKIYALRPWSAQVPKAVQCLVEHLRGSFAQGFSSAGADS
jgi:DNA-binding transcriptional LysR family regulator